MASPILFLLLALATLALALTLSTLLLLLRLRTILNPHRPRPSTSTTSTTTDPPRPRQTHIMIILGSGGHTAEMLAMLERSLHDPDPTRRLSWSAFTHRSWVVSAGDALSAERARAFERDVASSSSSSDGDGAQAFDVHVVSRARRIHQSLASTPVSALRCLAECVGVLLRGVKGGVGFPDVILCNGPATAAVMVLASVVLRVANVAGCETGGKMRTVYVESWARVKRLSLSGRLLLPVVDRFLVQWPQLVRPGGKAEYLGVLV